MNKLFFFLFLLTALSFVSTAPLKQEDQRPNIVWIMLEDWGYQLSCYGERGIETPNVDGLAADGIRFTNSFCTAPVCSPSRSAMITGFHQNYIGANQHRTDRWPSTYPTKSLEEWETVLEKFKPWVFRLPGNDVKHPFHPDD